MTEPVDIVKQAYAAFGRRDIPGILEQLTDDVEWICHAGTLPYGGRCTGKASVAKWFGTLAEWEDVQDFQPREFFAGADHVTVIGSMKARAMPQGRPFSTDWIHVFSFRGGRIGRWVGGSDTAARPAITT